MWPVYQIRTPSAAAARTGAHAGGAKKGQPPPGDQRIGIRNRSDDPLYPGGQQRVGTRGRATMVAAWFEGDIHGGPARAAASGLQGMHFGMPPAGAQMPAFTDDATIIDDDAADAWIRRRGVQTAFGQTQRPCHQFVVGATEARRHQRPIFCGERETSRISLENSSTSSKLRYTEAKRT